MKFRFTADLKFEADDLADAERRLASYFRSAASLASGEGAADEHPPMLRAVVGKLDPGPDSFVALDCYDHSLPTDASPEQEREALKLRDAISEQARERYNPQHLAREARKARALREYEEAFGHPPPGWPENAKG